MAKELSAETHHHIRTILTLAEYDLFQTFPLSDQTHAVRVLQKLQSNGQHHPNLLKAALLHDIGKTRLSLSVWDRSLNVLASTLMPQRISNWGQDTTTPFGWRKAFVIREQHAAWGAEMMAAIGADELTCHLIRHHQDTTAPQDQLTADLWQQLKWADDQS